MRSRPVAHAVVLKPAVRSVMALAGCCFVCVGCGSASHDRAERSVGCAAAVTYLGGGAGAGSTLASFTVRNKSGRRCRLARFPSVTLSRAGHSVEQAEDAPAEFIGTALRTIAPGGRADFVVLFRPLNATGSKSCRPATTARVRVSSAPAVTIALPQHGSFRDEPVPINPCSPYALSPFFSPPAGQSTKPATNAR